tara:strand:+ start:73 stop:258 length:186 start_codon:yes stop_codon:yes gene_type:complete
VLRNGIYSFCPSTVFIFDDDDDDESSDLIIIIFIEKVFQPCREKNIKRKKSKSNCDGILIE